MNWKRFLFIGLVLISPQIVLAQMPFIRGMMAQQPAAAGGGSMSYEGFEGTGAPTGWSTGTGINYDYTTSPAPLEGTQSLMVQNAVVEWTFSTAGAAQNECWVYFMFRVNDLVYLQNFQLGSDYSQTDAMVQINSGGTITLTSLGGTAATSGAGTVAANTTYYAWFRRVHVSTGNNLADFYWGTTNDRGSATHLAVTNGGNDYDQKSYIWRITSSNPADVLLIDHVIQSWTEIGSNP